MKVRIYYEDTDAGGIVYHANYIKFCERARSEMFFNSSVAPFTPNRHFVVTTMEAKFIKPAFLGDLLEIKTSIKSAKKASAILHQEIYKVGSLNATCAPQLIFQADITVAFLVDKKLAKMDDEIVEFMKSKQEN
ncbi:YbgC/FadM family acyl-CoA thioesterase [Campylobacter geochelonis]|uniref:Thioesterase family protein n=1 Tax=Campylobacter geochelonis TaxID=1780362 RepID=A0A128ERQ2_9BACT|nr:YbgC/FadM family acyl-CoA thioesterase [Campylobacter geochelonis]QKF71557.1 acyl-CoA thioesterase [Campylobacter geochelonis]CZE48766.1 thioesterase family protein [Campylobacter geochelonis]CZE49106.1 thioesterase family protein [Campylobacter geochelonis]CZE51343.1 thioesterase family protein [Campylobacter geochelonis]